MSSTGITEWIEIQNREKKRAQINEDRKKLTLPPRGCVESKKLYTKLLKENDNDFEDACFLLEWDQKVMRLALQAAALQAGKAVEQFIVDAASTVRLSAEEESEKNVRSVNNGEDPNQLKIGAKDKNGTVDKKGKVKDDGSTAEPASEVKTTKKAS